MASLEVSRSSMDASTYIAVFLDILIVLAVLC